MQHLPRESLSVNPLSSLPSTTHNSYKCTKVLTDA
jgi:hypothetical protein